jgi:hypothetical protein
MWWQVALAILSIYLFATLFVAAFAARDVLEQEMKDIRRDMGILEDEVRSVRIEAAGGRTRADDGDDDDGVRRACGCGSQFSEDYLRALDNEIKRGQKRALKRKGSRAQ